MNSHEGTCKAVQGNVWRKLFKLHKFSEIVHENNDPKFEQMLQSMQEGNHTQHDVMQIRVLVNTNAR